MIQHLSPLPIPEKSGAYFEAVSLVPKYVGAVLINGLCVGYMHADHG